MLPQCMLPQRGLGPQQKANLDHLMHFSLKIWHMVAPILLIFPGINEHTGQWWGQMPSQSTTLQRPDAISRLTATDTGNKRDETTEHRAAHWRHHMTPCRKTFGRPLVCCCELTQLRRMRTLLMITTTWHALCRLSVTNDKTKKQQSMFTQRRRRASVCPSVCLSHILSAYTISCPWSMSLTFTVREIERFIRWKQQICLHLIYIWRGGVTPLEFRNAI